MQLIEAMILGSAIVAAMAIPQLRIILIRLGGLIDVALFVLLFKTLGGTATGAAMASAIAMACTIFLFIFRGKFEYETELMWRTPVMGKHIKWFHIVLLTYILIAWIPAAFLKSGAVFLAYLVGIGIIVFFLRLKSDKEIATLKDNPEIFYFIRKNRIKDSFRLSK
jgi:hypothetical protein